MRLLAVAFALFVLASPGCVSVQNPGVETGEKQDVPVNDFGFGNSTPPDRGFPPGTRPGGGPGNMTVNGTFPQGPGGMGQENMTVAQMSERFGLEAETLIKIIVDEFNLTGNYTLNSSIGQMSEEYGQMLDMRRVFEKIMPPEKT